MGDIGIKITKKGKGIESTDPNDYILWTKYKTLMAIGKRTDTITLSHGVESGQVTFPHGFDFIPFVMMYIVVGGQPTYSIPFTYETDIYEDYLRWGDSGGERVSEGISAKINGTNLVFDWYAYSWNPQMQDSYPATTYDGSYDVTTYFYNLELGRVLPD